MQQAIAACRAADDPVDAAAALMGLLAVVAECAGSGWLKANGDDLDVARFTALLDSAAEPAPASGFPQASDLDDDRACARCVPDASTSEPAMGAYMSGRRSHIR